MRCIVLMVLTSTPAAVAHAQAADPPPAPAYPIEVVDRPLVMHAGMSELELYYSRAHGLVTTADGMGSPVTKRSSFGESARGLIGYGHSFGCTELIASLSSGGAMLGVRYAPTELLVVSLRVSGDGGTYVAGGTYYRLGQSLRARYRVVRVPRRFELIVNGGVVVQEYQVRQFDDSFREGVLVSADVGAYATVQLATHWSTYVGAGVGADVHDTTDADLGSVATLEAGLQLSLRRWDFLVGGGVIDVADTPRLFVAADVAWRWGL